MSFFDYANQKVKRKRKFTKLETQTGKKKGKKHQNNEEIDSSEEEELAEENQNNLNDKYKSDEEEETADQKRLRLAKKYLEEIEEEERDRTEFETDAVTKRLREEYLEEKGKLRKFIAINYTGHEEPVFLSRKFHRDSITCLCLSSDSKFLYSGSKDGTLVKWCLKDKTKIKMLKGCKKKDQIYMKAIRCIAVSSDNRFLVLGQIGTKDIIVLSANDFTHIKNLQGHRDIVTGLVFRKDTHTLYSASEDRSVKVWNLDDMAYVETLFGHQSGITSIDALARERAITSGGFDKTVRIWKIVEESQLIFNGHNGNIDVVKLINEENFLSCGDDGQLCLWGSMKKKPLFTVPEAHGIDENTGLPLWISSIATLLNTDLVASGSNSGSIKLWKCGDTFRSLTFLYEIQLPGFINALQFTPDGKYLIAGVGKEHKFGRWANVFGAKNRIAIIPLIYKNEKHK